LGLLALPSVGVGRPLTPTTPPPVVDSAIALASFL
jgi:hypothetical protein